MNILNIEYIEPIYDRSFSNTNESCHTKYSSRPSLRADANLSGCVPHHEVLLKEHVELLVRIGKPILNWGRGRLDIVALAVSTRSKHYALGLLLL